MSWVKIDDNAPGHRKQLAAGPVACWLWVCGLAYANRQPARDGFIPGPALCILYPIPGVAKVADKLVEVGLWDETPGGYLIHDYHEFQPSEDLRAKRSEAGKRGGKHSGEARRSKREASASSNPEASVLNPVPTRPDPIQEIPPTPQGGAGPVSESIRESPVRNVTDDGCGGFAVESWRDGLAKGLGRGITALAPAERRKLLQAFDAHAPKDGREAWAKTSGEAYARGAVASGREPSVYGFARWLDAGRPAPTAYGKTLDGPETQAEAQARIEKDRKREQERKREEAEAEAKRKSEGRITPEMFKAGLAAAGVEGGR